MSYRSHCPSHQVASAQVRMLGFHIKFFEILVMRSAQATLHSAISLGNLWKERDIYVASDFVALRNKNPVRISRKNRTRLKMKEWFHVDTESRRLWFIWYLWSKIQHVVYGWQEAYALPCFMISREQRKEMSPKEFWTGGLETTEH